MGEERKIRQVRSARQMPVRVQLLDDEILDVAVDKRAVGWVLFDIVCEQLNVIEKDYFGLNFINPEGVKYWLDNEKKIAKQMKGLVSLNLCFEIKFYPIDPLQMVEDITRYQLCLQIRRDIVNERVPCSTVTYALLGSFTAQSELGDYEVEDFGSGTSYLKDIQFAPKQDRDLLAQIAKLHKQHKGMTPEEAEIKFLENAEKLQFYGVEQHPAKDAEGKDISLGVCASGIIVYKDRQQVNRFVWPKILKMSYKRNKFYIKIRPGEFENFASLIGFRTVSVKMAKRLWKICVEHHSFFRFKEPEPVKSLSVIPRFGSRFRYSGRTQYQSRQYVTAEDRDMPSFDRVLSKRGTFGGRTQNMRKRDDDRKRQRDAMRREPPPPPVQQDFGPPQTKIPKERHEEPNGTPQEPRRTPPEPKHTPPEPKHAPPIAPKPKPQIAPKPKPVPRGPGSIDSGSRGSLNDSFEDVPDRRSRMEKMNAVMTPLAAVMQKSLQQNKHPEDEEVVGNHPQDDEHHDRHTDDEFEVGIMADRTARYRSGLTRNKGCRDTDMSQDECDIDGSTYESHIAAFQGKPRNCSLKQAAVTRFSLKSGDMAFHERSTNPTKYLFSYPSSSIDSILSDDCEEYDTESHTYKNGLKNVASEEFLNKPSNAATKQKQESKRSNGYSHSAENLLSEQTGSHYSEIESRTNEGIYAEIQDPNTSITSRRSNTLTDKPDIVKHDSSRPASIHGRRSKLFTPNQTNTVMISVEQDSIQSVSVRYEQKVKLNVSNSEERQVENYLNLPKSQVPKYAKVNKQRKNSTKKEQDSTSDSKHSKHGDQLNKTVGEPFYDSIDNVTRPVHERQDSQTSLKEELKMYIITPEKLKHNSATVTENIELENSEHYERNKYYSSFEKSGNNHNVKPGKSFGTSENGIRKDHEKNQDIVNSMNDETYTSTDLELDPCKSAKRNLPLDIKDDNFEHFESDLTSNSERKQIYQLTFDSNTIESPDTPKESPTETKQILHNNPHLQDESGNEYVNISTISNSSVNSIPSNHDLGEISDTLENSLELFCSLSTDSSDLDDSEKHKYRHNESPSTVTEPIQRTDKEIKVSKAEKPLPYSSNSFNDQSKKSGKPNTVLKKVTNLVKRVPGLGPKVSKHKDPFVCEELDQEPLRRMPVSQTKSEHKSMRSGKTQSKETNIKLNTEIHKEEPDKLPPKVKDTNENANEPSSLISDQGSNDISNTPNRSSYTDKSSNSDVNNVMDFFTKPKTLEEFRDKSNLEKEEILANMEQPVECGKSTDIDVKYDTRKDQTSHSDVKLSENGPESNDELSNERDQSLKIDTNEQGKTIDLNEQGKTIDMNEEGKTIVTNEQGKMIDTNEQGKTTDTIEQGKTKDIGEQSHFYEESKENKNPNPYWYRTHLLASTNPYKPVTGDNIKKECSKKEHDIVKSLSSEDNPHHDRAKEKVKEPCNTVDMAPKILKESKDVEGPKKRSKTRKAIKSATPLSKIVSQQNPPEVKDSKVFVSDHRNMDKTEPARIESKVILPLIPATNLMNTKPLYKLDYSSDSSSISSVNNELITGSLYKPEKGTRKYASSRFSDTNSTVSQRGSGPGSSKPNVMKGDRRKVHPGVTHMVRPSPAGWIEGGVKSSVTKCIPPSVIKQSDSDKHETGGPEKAKQLQTNVVANPTQKENLPISEKATEKSVHNLKEKDDRNKKQRDLSQKITDDEYKDDTDKLKKTAPDVPMSDNPIAPLSELLCKRVWKFSKVKKEDQDQSDAADEDDDDDFTRTIKKGPDYPDSNSASHVPLSETSNNNQDKNDASFSGNTSSFSTNQCKINTSEDGPLLTDSENQSQNVGEGIYTDDDSDGDQQHYNCKSNETDSDEETPTEQSGSFNKEKGITYKDNSEQDSKTQRDNVISNHDANYIGFQRKLKWKIYKKRMHRRPYDEDSGSEGSTSTSDSSSENSYDIEDRDSSGEEIVTFEMPKPSLSQSDMIDEHADIPFVDGEDSLSNDSTPDISGMVIDCSFEDVTSYQVNEKQTGYQGSNRSTTDVNKYSNSQTSNEDKYDVNYWDEDADFSDYDDPIGFTEDSFTVPDVVDHTPYKTGKSNLKSPHRKETCFFERRVHFPENLPFYKSRKNIDSLKDTPTSDSAMNRANEERNRMHHLEKFIVGLFDEEPRNLSIPKVDSNTDPSTSLPGLPESFKDISDDCGNVFGYHSAITSENVNFSLDSLQTFAIKNVISRDDIITTDLDAIDYNDDLFGPEASHNASSEACYTLPKSEKKHSPKIIKPVTGKRPKYTYGDHAEMSPSSQSQHSPSAHHFQAPTSKQNSYNQYNNTVSPHYRSSSQQPYTSQCSAELISDGPSDSRPHSHSSNVDISHPSHVSVYPTPISSVFYQNRPNKYYSEEPTQNDNHHLVQTDSPDTTHYVDVSELSKNEKPLNTKQNDNEKITKEYKEDQITQINTPDKVTRYSYSYADDSDPESPKIKYVTYEYVTEYKLNNVKVKYQHNKKVQTDLKLVHLGSDKVGSPTVKGIVTSDEKEVLDEIVESSEKKTNLAPPQKNDDKDGSQLSQNEQTNLSQESENEVLEEIVEPFVKKSFCMHLGEDNQVNNSVSKDIDLTGNTSKPIVIEESRQAVLEDVVEPYLRKSHCTPLANTDCPSIISPSESPSEIKVEKACDRSVGYPLAPIVGSKSDHSDDLKETILEETVEKSIAYQFSNLTENMKCNKQKESDGGKDSPKYCTDNRQAYKVDSKDTNKSFGKGYTEKQVLEYNSEKYVFQCYQPTMYSSRRFPRYLPGCKGRDIEGDLCKKRMHFRSKKDKLLQDGDTGSVEKGTEDSFEKEIADISKDFDDSGYITFIESQNHENVIDSAQENETDTAKQSENLYNELMVDKDNFYATVMQEELPDLYIEESTEDKLFVIQTMAIMAFGAVLVFLFPYMA